MKDLKSWKSYSEENKLDVKTRKGFIEMLKFFTGRANFNSMINMVFFTSDDQSNLLAIEVRPCDEYIVISVGSFPTNSEIMRFNITASLTVIFRDENYAGTILDDIEDIETVIETLQGKPELSAFNATILNIFTVMKDNNMTK